MKTCSLRCGLCLGQQPQEHEARDVIFLVRKRGSTAELALVLFQDVSMPSLFFEPMIADIGRSMLHFVSYFFPISPLLFAQLEPWKRGPYAMEEEKAIKPGSR